MLGNLESLYFSDPNFVNDTLVSLDGKVARQRIESRLATLERNSAEHGVHATAADALEWRLLLRTAKELQIKKHAGAVPPSAYHTALPEASMMMDNGTDQAQIHEAQVLLSGQLTLSDLPRIADLRSLFGDGSIAVNQMHSVAEEIKANLWLAERRLAQLAVEQQNRESTAQLDCEAAESEKKALAEGKRQLQSFSFGVQQSRVQDEMAEQRRRENAKKALARLQTQRRCTASLCLPVLPCCVHHSHI